MNTDIAVPSLVDRFAEAAEAARHAEDAYRREAAQRIAVLARERAYAFRRMNLVRTIAAAIAPQEDAVIAAAAARAAVLVEIGWSEESAGRTAVLDRLQPVLEGAAAETLEGCPARPPLPEQMRAFEDWYETETGTAFYALFDRYVPETPVVDF